METVRDVRAPTQTEPRLHQRRITFDLPDGEADDLIAAAERAGRSLGSYIRARLFAPSATRPPVGQAIDVIALTRLQAQVERVGGDIHELLRWVKFGHSPLAEEFRAALAKCGNLVAAIEQVLPRKRSGGRTTRTRSQACHR